MVMEVEKNPVQESTSQSSESEVLRQKGNVCYKSQNIPEGTMNLIA